MADHLLPNISTTTRGHDTKGLENVEQFVNTSFNMSVRHSSLHLTVVADKQVSQPANVTILTSIRRRRWDWIHRALLGGVHLWQQAIVEWINGNDTFWQACKFFRLVGLLAVTLAASQTPVCCLSRPHSVYHQRRVLSQLCSIYDI